MMIRKGNLSFIGIIGCLAMLFFGACHPKKGSDKTAIRILKKAFMNPPDSTRPGVYWYFMDGHMSKEGMTKDLESMKKAGIGKLVFLEVNVGIPRGPIDFLSDEWLALFKHAVQESQRLGIQITLGIGPGWTGSGGPWVSMDESMQHLVSSSIQVSGGINKPIKLPLPQPKKPYFGEGTLTPELKEKWENFYEDVAVLAFPTPQTSGQIKDIDEKALYYRAPFSSRPGVQPFLPLLSQYHDSSQADIAAKQVLNLTDKLQSDGTLNWTVPPGNWTIMRFVSRNNGAVTRPAPVPGLGFESDKFDTTALNHHLDAYIGRIFHEIGVQDNPSSGGLKMLHMDSWEMGAQNWTPAFREEFMKRRGYDPLPFYPVYAGRIIESRETSERFLWDLRQTCQELVLENHAAHVKAYAHSHGLGLSIEPYDMNPTADLALGALADIPMAEFWSKGYGFNSSFSCIEATSIAHVNGEPIVQSEAFTADGSEAWKQYPGSMKNQGDWAFATGINQFFYHTFEHKPWADSLSPGMTMGPYGVHWDRKQTWWPMVINYHRYIARCQYILQQGMAVADILYLTPEGAPQVFLPPSSAMTSDSVLPDRKGYNFDGCAPEQLYRATVKDHRIVFPGGASYRIMVLPAVEAMTPRLLEKIKSLTNAGAMVIGSPPHRSPGLSGYPQSDKQVQALASELWGAINLPQDKTEHPYGNGKVIWGGNLVVDRADHRLYPDYDQTARLLQEMGVSEDFSSATPLRYTHRRTEDWDIYFVSNKTDHPLKSLCTFRTTKGTPELWDPLTGKTRTLSVFSTEGENTAVPLQFEAYQSFFIVFAKNGATSAAAQDNFPDEETALVLSGSWEVSFDPRWGGPASIQFDSLEDWTRRREEGIKYYSGMATYKKRFDLRTEIDTTKGRQLFLDLGHVKNLAQVTLNGHDLGSVWTAPWKVDITGSIKKQGNQLEIRVTNLWPNRLIGDAQWPDDGVKDGKLPDWLLHGDKRLSNRYTFTTYPYYKKEDSLLSSGLLGPVTIRQTHFGNRDQ